MKYSKRGTEFRWNATLLTPTFVVYLAVFVIPVAAVVIQSLISDNHFSTQWYEQVLGEDYYWLVLGRSIWLSFLAAAISIIVGYSLAYISDRLFVSRTVKKLVLIAVFTPLFTSAVVRAFGWQIVLGSDGIINQILVGFGLVEAPLRLMFNYLGVVVGLVQFLVPFAFLTSSASLQSHDLSLVRASRDLGGSPWSTFWRITVPLSRTALLASFSINFALAISSYVVPAVLGGGRVKVMAALVYETFSIDLNWQLGSAIAVFVFIPVMVVLFSLEVLGRRTAIPTRSDQS
ncbi:ABC transporter permease [Brevibacterium sp. FAM 24638]|uniref:ABC transporter permease n=1 Tax=Brevibacterium sp. FAM 24638 TaxID=3415681 RepID=UPI003C7BD153